MIRRLYENDHDECAALLKRQAAENLTNIGDTGGGTQINSFDDCCRTHDIQIKGKKGTDSRCPAYKNFMNCTSGKTAPGDTTMRTGIQYEALANGCGLI
ncbi:MAG: hypothetical protein ACI4XL_01505 [Bacillus sp. (in: firmicutes)]